MNRNYFLHGAIFGAGVLAIVGAYLDPTLWWVELIGKTITMLLIVALALSRSREVAGRYRAAVIAGLLLGLAGDILLVWPGDLFMPGLVAFLLAHLAYIVAFTSEAKLAARAWPFGLFGFLGLGILFFLWSGVAPALRIPVTVYVVVIVVMTSQSAVRALLLEKKTATLAAVGAVFFMLSDTLLAFNRFHAPFGSAALLVLGTYYAAQWLMAMSVRDEGRHLTPKSTTHA